MADLIRNAAPLRFRTEQPFIERWTLDNSAAQSIFYGQPMIVDKSADTRYARGWLAATTLVTATDVFIGIANEPRVVLTTDIETDNEVEVITRGEVGFKSTVFTDSDVGKRIVFTDSGTLAANTEAAARLEIGTITRVAEGYVYVMLNAPKVMSF